MITYIAYGLGVTLNGAIFYFVSSWQLVLLLFQVVPMSIVLLLFILVIENTPFDLITRNSPEAAREALLNVATMNNGSQII